MNKDRVLHCQAAMNGYVSQGYYYMMLGPFAWETLEEERKPFYQDEGSIITGKVIAVIYLRQAFQAVKRGIQRDC